MWDDCVVDLETMGMPPDGAIVALGAVFVDIEGAAIGPTFYRSVHLATSVRLGMTIDPATVMWWLRQDETARLTIANNTHDILVVLREFADFIAEHSRVQDVRIYGNGASFDNTILGTAYKLAGIEQPWRFNKERCFRTVRNMYPQIEYNPADRKSTYHNALDDAVFEAEHLIRIKHRGK